MAGFPFGIVLVVLCLGTLAWGVTCAVIGGIVRMNLAQYVNAYIGNVDPEFINFQSDGMITVKKSYEEADLGTAARTIGIMAIIVGILCTVYSLLGLAAGMLKNMTLLFILIGCILICTMLQFVTIWMIVDVNSSFHDSAKDDLVEKLRQTYNLGKDVEPWTMMMNSLMLAGQCCGINGPEDFPNLTYPYASGMIQYMMLSPACCKDSIWREGRDELILCAINKNSNQNTDGCYNTVFNDASEANMKVYMFLIIFAALIELVIMAVGVLMLFNPPDEEAGKGKSQGPSDKGIAEAVPEAEMKVFTPFSKMSSYQSSDINRIKSTEIW